MAENKFFSSPSVDVIESSTKILGDIVSKADFRIDGVVEGTFYNPYAETMQNGLLLFENVIIGTDTANTFYSDFY